MLARFATPTTVNACAGGAVSGRNYIAEIVAIRAQYDSDKDALMRLYFGKRYSIAT